jgi:RHS repeat-associated protein
LWGQSLSDPVTSQERPLNIQAILFPRWPTRAGSRAKTSEKWLKLEAPARLHPTSLSDSLGGVASDTYDHRDERINETLSGTGLSPEAVSFAYDNAGNMTGLTRYANLAETTVVASTAYAYDPANQLTGVTHKNAGGTTLVSYGETYDAAGRVTQEARTWGSGSTSDTLTYGYTNNNQLTSVTHTNGSFAGESFAWDANGNQTGTGYTTTTGNEQTASPGWTYTDDADGNTIAATQTSTGDVWTYTYDFRDRMTGAVEKTSTGTILAQATYTYDALDNRIGMNENGAQTWTLYDGSSPAIDFTGSGSLAMRYLNGPAGDVVDTVLARQAANGTVSWYLPDRLGTIRDLINNSGSMIDHIDYSAFGTQLGESSPSNGDRMMGFAGLVRDAASGLNLAVHRVQTPWTGRWTTRDPIGFSGADVNLYRYVHNHPYDGLDRTGNADEDPPKGGHNTGKSPSKREGHEHGDARRRQDQNNKKPNHTRYREYQEMKQPKRKPSGPKGHVNKYKKPPIIPVPPVSPATETCIFPWFILKYQIDPMFWPPEWGPPQA